MSSEEGTAWGFFNQIFAPETLLEHASESARKLIAGPIFAHSMTKTMLNQEWNMSLEQSIEAEAQAQALCMQTRDFKRAFEAYVAKEKPIFEGK